ncbi:MAG: two-component regulator propeller domain-containing protein [Chryseolinea sp.]
MKAIRIYILLSLFIFYNACEAQKKTDPPREVIFSQGPSGISRTLAQDRNGNIWIASWQGVFRYDGKSFTNVTTDVSSARFFSVLEDRQGHLWFGTIGSGVYYYDGKSFRNFTTKDGLLNNEITCIYEDKAGNVWLGINGGVSRYDGKSFRNFLISGNSIIEDKTGKTIPDFTRPPDEVSTIIEDKAGNLWLGARSNAFVYDGKTFTVLTDKGKPFINVRTIIKDKKGNIWLGGQYGLWRYNGNTYSNVTQNFVGYLLEDKKGNVWTSSQIANQNNWALSRYEEKSLVNDKPTVTEIASEGMIFGILEVNDGSIWYGASNGVHRYDGTTVQDFKVK